MKKVKQTPEERKAKQKLAGEIYRNSWSPERRAEVNEQKRLYGLKNKEKLAEKRKLVTAWLQASKHVTKYCNTQRVAINSNQFWSRWA